MRRRWTDKEFEFLSDYYGLKSTGEIAATLHRTPKAILKKAAKSGIRLTDNFYSSNLLGRELGKSPTTIMEFHRQGCLEGKVSENHWGYMRPPMMFMEVDVVKFLKNYGHKFNINKVANLYFKNIIKEIIRERR